MGKFSKPRNSEWYQDNIQHPIPAPPADTSQVSAPATEEFERAAVPVEETCEEAVPEAPETDDFFDTPEYAEPKEKKAGSSKKLSKILLICLCSVLVVALVGSIGAFAYLTATDPNEGKILNNVSVAGINIGNLTKAEAKAALHAATDHTYSAQPMVVKFPGGQIELRPEDTGARLDVNAVINAAYEYGRTGTQEERERARAASMNAHCGTSQWS